MFGADADQVVIANTKGFTGHPMGVGIEDVVAVKALETGLVPPVPNFREADPGLGTLNLSKGGVYPVRYALRLAAGFGSQIAMSLLRWTPLPDGRHRNPEELGYGYRVADPDAFRAWLAQVTGDDRPELEVVQRRLRSSTTAWPRPRPRPPRCRPPRRADAGRGATARTAGTCCAPPPLPGRPPRRRRRIDQRRHGMILGMGAAALVVEAADAARERGIAPICEVLGVVTANSAFHGTRLDVEHISSVMETVVAEAEARGNVTRHELAPQTVFVSHETYTPARGGSAAAEIHALRQVFGADADQVVIANTKGFTGHPMGVGIEDVVAVKALETGLVPPVPNFREADPGLGTLNLSKGGVYPVRYALRLAAGFGSQIAMSLLRWTPLPDGRHRNPEELGYGYRVADPDAFRAWLTRVTGDDRPELEVVQRRLRLVDHGPAAAPAAPAAAPATAPAPMPVAAPPPAPPSPPAPQEAAPAAPSVEAVAVAAPVDGGEDEVAARVLAVVAEQTGYPPDLLDLDLDLEADLGIDTVKQAEVFASIRESYGIERDESLQLRDYPTLAHVIGFVRDRRPDQPTAVVAEAGAAQPGAADAVAPVVDDAGFPRRVPVPVLRPPITACGETGVDLGAGSRVLLVPDAGGVGAALVGRLEARGVEVLVVDDDPSAGELEERLAAWSAAGPVTGAYWLAALDDEGPLAALDADAWHAALHRRVKLLAVAMRALAEQVGPAGTFLVTATRLGGRHGYDPAGASAPLGGAVSGFTKALARERVDALVKVVDVEPSRKTAALADLLVDETLRDPATVEVGHADGLRWGIGLDEVAAVPDEARALTADDVVVVTGAAGSIVSAITADLAAASGATFHLLDLVGAPDPSDPDLDRFESDPEGLKRELAERIADRGERPTPKLIERELAGIERARAAQAAIDAVTAAGGTAHWHQVNLTDGAAVRSVVEAITGAHDRVDVLLHCAGLEISHFLPDKPQAEYDLVFDVKADGFFHLLSALGDTPLGSVVVFSSIAGRFGNGGQTDYSAANDLLCKIVSSFRTTRPGTRGIAVDWTAWAGIGMASRGSIPKMMAMAGIDMLPPEVGVPVVRRELTAGGAGVEIVEAGSLGILLEERPLAVDLPAGGPMAARVAGATLAEGFVVATEVGVDQPFLDDHRIDGTPVLPGVMGVEAFAEAARLVVPDRPVVAIADVDFLAPFKLYRDAPRTVEVHARVVADGDDLVAHCALVGRRTLPGQDEVATVHFRGAVRLGRAAPEAPPAPTSAPDPADGAAVAGDVYEVYFHGPAYQVLGAVWADETTAYGRLAEGLGPNHQPVEARLETAPRLLELCFQTAGVLELGTEGRMALPTHADRIVVFPGAGEGERVTAAVTRRDDGAVGSGRAGSRGTGVAAAGGVPHGRAARTGRRGGAGAAAGGRGELPRRVLTGRGRGDDVTRRARSGSEAPGRWAHRHEGEGQRGPCHSR
ncbi:MAG: SDR family NAD(P)-dependent oxidoreductase [Acidimicrobiales bacterium]